MYIALVLVRGKVSGSSSLLRKSSLASRSEELGASSSLSSSVAYFSGLPTDSDFVGWAGLVVGRKSGAVERIAFVNAS
jgi:hypothetical protein